MYAPPGLNGLNEEGKIRVILHRSDCQQIIVFSLVTFIIHSKMQLDASSCQVARMMQIFITTKLIRFEMMAIRAVPGHFCALGMRGATSSSC